MSATGAWVSIVVMIVLTVLAQIGLKLRVVASGVVEPGIGGAADYIGRMLLDPWVWACLFAGFLAALCWIAALSRLSLTVAYPFISVTIAAVVVANTIVLGEPLRFLHVMGIALIGAGLFTIAQG